MHRSKKSGKTPILVHFLFNVAIDSNDRTTTVDFIDEKKNNKRICWQYVQMSPILFYPATADLFALR